MQKQSHCYSKTVFAYKMAYFMFQRRFILSTTGFFPNYQKSGEFPEKLKAFVECES